MLRESLRGDFVSEFDGILEPIAPEVQSLSFTNCYRAHPVFTSPSILMFAIVCIRLPSFATFFNVASFLLWLLASPLLSWCISWTEFNSSQTVSFGGNLCHRSCDNLWRSWDASRCQACPEDASRPCRSQIRSDQTIFFLNNMCFVLSFFLFFSLSLSLLSLYCML